MYEESRRPGSVVWIVRSLYPAVDNWADDDDDDVVFIKTASVTTRHQVDFELIHSWNS